MAIPVDGIIEDPDSFDSGTVRCEVRLCAPENGFTTIESNEAPPGTVLYPVSEGVAIGTEFHGDGYTNIIHSAIMDGFCHTS